MPWNCFKKENHFLNIFTLKCIFVNAVLHMMTILPDINILYNFPLLTAKDNYLYIINCFFLMTRNSTMNNTV